MSLKNCPFVTVLRLNQKIRLKTPMDRAEKENRLAQLSHFSSQLRQGLDLG